jgi:uncharacterized membrane protein
MNYKSLIIVTIATILYAAIDMLWAGYFMKELYMNSLLHVIRPISQWGFMHGVAGALRWFLVVLGVFIFVLPLTVNKSVAKTFLYGALFGAISYGLYESTNYALIYAWQPAMVIVDTGWGIFASGFIAVVMKYLLQSWLTKK